MKNQNVVNRRRMRIRKRVLGSSVRPRLSLHFSNAHAYAQCINDENGTTLVYLSTVSHSQKQNRINVESIEKFGCEFGKLACSRGISTVVFDRGIKKYHGKVKAFADAVRKEGVQF